MNCVYCQEEFCTNDQCPMCADYCPVPFTEGVCKFERREEEIWTLTPECCFSIAITDHIKADENTIKLMWQDFYTLMKKCGYLEESGE